MTIWIYFFTISLAFLAGILLIFSNKQSSKELQVLSRIQALMPLSIDVESIKLDGTLSSTHKTSKFLADSLGMNFPFKLVLTSVLLLSLNIIFVTYLFNIKAGLITALILAIGLVVYLIYKSNKQKRLIIAQLPLFLDQLIRSLSTGRSIESAIKLVTSETANPLKAVFDKVIRATDLGAGFTDALVREMQFYNIKELEMIAIGIKISSSYGSSPKEMLSSVMQMINQQEEARRDLAAMTGETKLSALVLLITPVLILIYMIVMNPSYLEMMTSSKQGMTVLQVATGMQIAGALIFWRMFKSL